MNIVKGWPPNIEEIKRYLPVTEERLFCYGDTVYNPSGQEISPDIQFHEQIHIKQQKIFGLPELWWRKYLMDKEFRYSQELEAYAEQYNFVKKFYPAVAVKECLNELSENLATLYGLNLFKSTAETKIRIKAKCLIT